ncbi:class I SAM-dependent methyltransferase [Actinomadura macrotermitis]|uniref:Trans-aconitate 2-methyltransferase n=1 Tax=Actinomadura macrotermitis TaxID=2585200 RepID=A0A7K0C037_9ACTN|nr:methyltransferase domain-containing protein [Actinomadura macrotermitis]MQY06813.1 Trans-aconitate 2-methyltransferase [Actinomadura macrotermitis]
MGDNGEKYGDEIFSHGDDGEADPIEKERVDALAEALDPASFATLAAVPVGKDARCLEVGAGTGSVARWLADRFPKGSVTATDLDLDLIEEDERPNLRYLRHDVTSDDFPPSSFDLIHTRFLLPHLPSRDAVLGRMIEWLAPGGWVVLEESALFPFESSPHDCFRRTSLGVFTVIAERFGNDSRWARNLPTLIAESGLAEASMSAACPPISAGSAMAGFWRLTIEQLRSELIELPELSEEDVDTALAQFDDPNFFDLGIATVTVTARRPPAST